MSRTGSMRSTQKIVLSLLIVCFLVLGLLVAVLLVRQQQDVRSGAAAVPGSVSVLAHNGVAIDSMNGIAIGGSVVDIQRDYFKVTDSKGIVYTLLFDAAYPGALTLQTSTELGESQEWIYYDSSNIQQVLKIGSKVVAYVKDEGDRNAKYQSISSTSNPVIGTIDKIVIVNK